MPQCSVCGIECDCFELVSGDQHFYFDRMACAVEVLRPRCAHCGESIRAKAVEFNGESYCSVPCVCDWDANIESSVPAKRRRVARSRESALLAQSR